MTSTLETALTPSPPSDIGVILYLDLDSSANVNLSSTNTSDVIRRSHGGTDMKVTSSVLARTLEFVAQSGPTWDPLPPFRWADQGGLRLD